MTEDITEEQAEVILRGFADQKESLHSFFIRVIKNDDSTKIGNVTSDELGISNHPVRCYKEIAHFFKKVCKNEKFAEYFEGLAEIQLATGLSKDGFLIKQVGTKRTEMADMTPKERKPNSGMFKSKKNPNENI